MLAMTDEIPIINIFRLFIDSGEMSFERMKRKRGEGEMMVVVIKFYVFCRLIRCQVDYFKRRYQLWPD